MNKHDVPHTGLKPLDLSELNEEDVCDFTEAEMVQLRALLLMQRQLAAIAENGIFGTMVDRAAMERAAELLEVDAALDTGSLGGVAVEGRAARQRETAAAIRLWLIPRYEKPGG